MPRRRRDRHGRQYAHRMTEHEAEDFSQPLLAGTAPTDYERYLNTEELLALQKGPDEWVHRDELLFQVVHQSSELWLKLASHEARSARRRRSRGGGARRRSPLPAPGRAVLALRHRPARHARADVAVGVPDDPGGARARLRVRLTRLQRACAPRCRLSAPHSTRRASRPACPSPSSTCTAASTRTCTSSPKG